MRSFTPTKKDRPLGSHSPHNQATSPDLHPQQRMHVLYAYAHTYRAFPILLKILLPQSPQGRGEKRSFLSAISQDNHIRRTGRKGKKGERWGSCSRLGLSAKGTSVPKKILSNILYKKETPSPKKRKEKKRKEKNALCRWFNLLLLFPFIASFLLFPSKHRRRGRIEKKIASTIPSSSKTSVSHKKERGKLFLSLGAFFPLLLPSSSPPSFCKRRNILRPFPPSPSFSSSSSCSSKCLEGKGACAHSAFPHLFPKKKITRKVPPRRRRKGGKGIGGARACFLFLLLLFILSFPARVGL